MQATTPRQALQDLARPDLVVVVVVVVTTTARVALQAARVASVDPKRAHVRPRLVEAERQVPREVFLWAVPEAPAMPATASTQEVVVEAEAGVSPEAALAATAASLGVAEGAVAPVQLLEAQEPAERAGTGLST